MSTSVPASSIRLRDHRPKTCGSHSWPVPWRVQLPRCDVTAGDLRAQQQHRFNQFRRIYNDERPHEALNLETPASVYRPSPRLYVDRPPELEYPGHYELRLVAGDNTIKWKTRKVFVSGLLRHRVIGLVADGLWAVYHGPLRLGWLDEADYRIMDVKERAQRRR